MLAAGSTFGRYRIERELGAGGMGSVYAAQDTVLRRAVALKIVRKTDDEDAAARLLREARAAAALRHPNAVAVFDVGENDGIPFIAMELVTGRTLSAFVQDSSVSLARKTSWLLGTARALAAAHREGIVHRDVKPENVMVTGDGSVKVLDFGIAKRAGVAVALPEATDGPASFRTKEGIITGTPRYMAPEQLAGATLDARADQFAWGVVAYELLSGVHPQTTTGTAERWGAPPKPLSAIAPSVPEPLSNAVMRALERWPEHRWPSMDDVVRALDDEAAEPSFELPVTDAGPSPAQPTMRLEANETAATAAGPLLPRTIANATISDPHRPTWRRLAVPAVGLALMFSGLAVMLVVIVVLGGQSTPPLGKALLRIGWLAILAAPVLEIARRPRAARIDASQGRVVIGGARGMSQTLDASSITGASLAPIEGGRFSVVVAPRRVGTIPVVLDVPSEDDAHAILAALGIGDGRALSGVIGWPLRRGAFDVFRLVVAVTWRTAMVVTLLPASDVLSSLAFALSVLAGLAAIGLAFAPWTGPHLELTTDQIRVEGRVVPLRDITAVSATDDAIVVRLRTEETITLRAPVAKVSRRALAAEERAHLVRHVDAAAIRARAGWSAR